jgi:hypothetical protein
VAYTKAIILGRKTVNSAGQILKVLQVNYMILFLLHILIVCTKAIKPALTAENTYFYNSVWTFEFRPLYVDQTSCKRNILSQVGIFKGRAPQDFKGMINVSGMIVRICKKLREATCTKFNSQLLEIIRALKQKVAI